MCLPRVQGKRLLADLHEAQIARHPQEDKKRQSSKLSRTALASDTTRKTQAFCDLTRDGVLDVSSTAQRHPPTPFAEQFNPPTSRDAKCSASSACLPSKATSSSRADRNLRSANPSLRVPEYTTAWRKVLAQPPLSPDTQAANASAGEGDDTGVREWMVDVAKSLSRRRKYAYPGMGVSVQLKPPRKLPILPFLFPNHEFASAVTDYYRGIVAVANTSSFCYPKEVFVEGSDWGWSPSVMLPSGPQVLGPGQMVSINAGLGLLHGDVIHQEIVTSRPAAHGSATFLKMLHYRLRSTNIIT